MSAKLRVFYLGTDSFFSSVKTLLTRTEDTPHPVNVLSRYAWPVFR
jgi:hypothetical protein